MNNILYYKYVYELKYMYATQKFEIVGKYIPVYENKDYIFCKNHGTTELTKFSQKYIISSVSELIEEIKGLNVNNYFSWSIKNFYIGIVNKNYNKDLYNTMESVVKNNSLTIQDFIKNFMDQTEYQNFIKKEKLKKLENDLNKNNKNIEKYYREIVELESKNLLIQSAINNIELELSI